MSCAYLGIVQFLLELDTCLIREAGNNGQLPIHVACGGFETSKLEVLITLVECYSESLQVADDDGQLPLHIYLCQVDDIELQADFLQLLLEVYPDAIHHANGNGLLPLHSACMNRRIHLDSIRLLVEAGDLSDLLRTAGGSNELPL